MTNIANSVLGRRGVGDFNARWLYWLRALRPLTRGRADPTARPSSNADRTVPALYASTEARAFSDEEWHAGWPT
ncbi:MAG TPA: hypothetical protein VHR66_10825 [Gemmataceae bacterium]|jgi:hypothetical protein|nr:hypothetical protein [Gemmataceae bacterium]